MTCTDQCSGEGKQCLTHLYDEDREAIRTIRIALLLQDTQQPASVAAAIRYALRLTASVITQTQQQQKAAPDVPALNK